MDIFKEVESEVRSYCRSFPVVFNKAENDILFTEDGKKYIDFFAGAGSLNYGHNPKDMMEALKGYIDEGGILHGLDMMTKAKRVFLEDFHSTILKPRKMGDYRVMFPGPTGTNSVEAALKLARKVKKRENIVAFTNSFHGMTIGALAVTGNQMKRHGAGMGLDNTYFMPYDKYHGDNVNTAEMFERYLNDNGSGYDTPAAVIVETVQGEGGVNAASKEWLLDIQRICHEHDILLIADDIQIGCGRSGKFFSFEEFGLEPDIVCLSKSLSGCGLPFAVTVFRKDLDIWGPGEHNGTFRGNNFAFVTASKALERWKDNKFEKEIASKVEMLDKGINDVISLNKDAMKAKGRGLMRGIEFTQKPDLADKVAAKCFEHGLIIETSGINDQVLKFLPALSMTEENLKAGVDIIKTVVKEHL